MRNLDCIFLSKSTGILSKSFVLVLMLLIGCKSENESVVQPKPNVVFILADDLGWKDLSYSGSQFYETPHIDGIATQGISFSQGYAACQVCSPSRASIMTGKFPARHGITDWIGAKADTVWRQKKRYSKLLPADYLRALPEKDTTIAEAFQNAGFTTFFAGKWHLGHQGSWPEDHGFDINIGGWDSGSPKGGYFSPWKNPKLENKVNAENLSMRLANETVDFMKAHHPDSTGKPFFAFLSFYAVHSPIQTTKEKWAKYRDKAEALKIEDSGYAMGKFLPIRQTQDNPIYAGLVESMDDAVGRVLEGIEQLGLEDNTIVVFTSDNGGVASGDAYSTSNLPLRGGKGYQFEGGVREPFLIKIPWRKTKGVEISTPVIATDFYPTLLDYARIPLNPNQHQDGMSLLPVIEGEETKERSFIWHYPHYGNQGGEPSSFIRKGNWKLIYYYEDERVALYNLNLDLDESRNLATEHPRKVSSLKQELFDYLDNVNAKFPKKDPEYDAEKEKAYLDKIKQEKLPQLEKKRKVILSKDFDARNWWGSYSDKE